MCNNDGYHKEIFVLGVDKLQMWITEWLSYNAELDLVQYFVNLSYSHIHVGLMAIVQIEPFIEIPGKFLPLDSVVWKYWHE